MTKIEARTPKIQLLKMIFSCETICSWGCCKSPLVPYTKGSKARMILNSQIWFVILC